MGNKTDDLVFDAIFTNEIFFLPRFVFCIKETSSRSKIPASDFFLISLPGSLYYFSN